MLPGPGSGKCRKKVGSRDSLPSAEASASPRGGVKEKPKRLILLKVRRNPITGRMKRGGASEQYLGGGRTCVSKTREGRGGTARTSFAGEGMRVWTGLRLIKRPKSAKMQRQANARKEI